jgi:hypothetical protein
MADEKSLKTLATVLPLADPLLVGPAVGRGRRHPGVRVRRLPVVWTAAAIWLIYRIVKGWLSLNENQGLP